MSFDANIHASKPYRCRSKDVQFKSECQRHYKACPPCQSKRPRLNSASAPCDSQLYILGSCVSQGIAIESRLTKQMTRLCHTAKGPSVELVCLQTGSALRCPLHGAPRIAASSPRLSSRKIRNASTSHVQYQSHGSDLLPRPRAKLLGVNQKFAQGFFYNVSLPLLQTRNGFAIILC